MNIGIDIDDTVCFTFESYITYAIKFNCERGIANSFPLDFTHHDVKEIFSWSKREEELFEKKYHDIIILHNRPKPLAIEVIKQLKQEGHKILGLSKKMRRFFALFLLTQPSNH
jgi:hypothetical protein